MRAGPLSNAKVISLLNQYFVPVYVSNEDYSEEGKAPAEDKAEKNRIYHETLKANLSAGTVHVYLLKPDGHVIDSMHVAEAAKPERSIAMLERAVEKLKISKGAPLVKPVSQSVPPKALADSLVLHLTARSIRPGGAWGEFPAENWIVLQRREWTKLLPPGGSGSDTSWDIDKEVAAKLLTHFYPATENNDLSKNRIQQQTLKARVLSVQDGRTRVRLDGSLKMKHTFYHRDDKNVVEATVVGFLDFEPDKPKVRALRLVTQEAAYGGGTFGVAVHSVP